MTKIYLCFLTALSLLGLVSCCAVGPDFHSPTAPSAAGYTTKPLTATASASHTQNGEEQSFVKDMNIPSQWWTLFRSPALNSLVEESIKANPTLVAAKAALREAKENVAAQRGFYFPTVQAGASASPQKNATETIAPTLTSGASYFTLYNAQVNVSFTPDVFGLNRRQVESLSAQADFERFQIEAAYLTLTSNVVAAAIQEASLRAQETAAEKTIKIAKKLLSILRGQRALGYVTGLDVAAQEAALAQVEATLPPIEKQLQQNRDLLKALAGQFPNKELTEKFSLDSLRLPRELPLSLPSELVRQRPDIRAAEAQLHSACAQVGVATANMLPQFTLTGSAGGTSTSLGSLFVPGNTFWNITGSAVQTIFDAGTLLHRKRAAQAALDQSAAQYRNTVINAFQNVADTLHALQSDARCP